MAPDSTFPEWWNWELSFTAHAELRMEQRGVMEVDVRAMLEQATLESPAVRPRGDAAERTRLPAGSGSVRRLVPATQVGLRHFLIVARIRPAQDAGASRQKRTRTPS
jgi:hypothetical protein